MTFTATAIIISIEKLSDKFFKVLLQDDRRNHIVVNIPVDKEAELTTNGKVTVWGNVSAFQYQSKWYNNLFAQTVVPENKKYILIQRDTSSTNAKDFKIVEYSSELFSEEYINSKYKQTKDEQSDENNSRVSLETLKQLAKDSISKKSLLDLTSKPIDFINIEYSHLQNILSKKLITLDNNIIHPLENTVHFTKKQGKAELIIFHKIEGEMIELESLQSLAP